MDSATAKQQIAERVKQANKFLVTVNSNPSLDQLAACIGLTLMLNKMGKHATAVFSGKVPSNIEFLQPDKTLQKNTDALQDFIISLDKNKADKLRYKVEDDVVRIFITPYRTSISEKDLVFSEGDFNVEAVIALGVTQRTQLDAAITVHGRILHDATVISVNTGAGNPPQLGQINWVEPTASSLCEMLVSISEAFGAGLIDSQIATAFLTGIVSETDRFSNPKTSPKVMTMSAQLMAAGANQQLISEKLEPPPPPPPPPPQKPPEPPKKPPPPKPKKPPIKPEGEIDLRHHEKKADKTGRDQHTSEIRIDEQGNLVADQIIREAEGPAVSVPAKAPDATIQEAARYLADGTEPSPLPPPAPKTEELEELPADSPFAFASSRTPAPPSAPELPKVSNVKSYQEPPPLPPAPPPPPPLNNAPENKHAFLGSTGQPAGLGMPVSNSTAPNWAAPYDLIPMDPMAKEGASASEFGNSQAASNPETTAGNFGQGHAINPPGQQTSPGGVDNARSAVEQALAATDFNPNDAPVQALNAQQLGPGPISHDPPQPPPQTANSDTPMFVLPGDNNSSAAATQPISTQTNQAASGVAPAAPPPVPPPLITASGAVVPNVAPPQQ